MAHRLPINRPRPGLVRIGFGLCLTFGVVVVFAELNLILPYITSSITAWRALAENGGGNTDNAMSSKDGGVLDVYIRKQGLSDSWIIHVIKVPLDSENDNACDPGENCQKKSSSVKTVTKADSSKNGTKKEAQDVHSALNITTGSGAADVSKILRDATASKPKSLDLNAPKADNGAKANNSKTQTGQDYEELEDDSDEIWDSGNVTVSETHKIVNPHDFDYIHNVPNACAKNQHVDLLVGVTGRTNDFEARTAIRDTWGQFKGNSSLQGVVLFFLGSTTNKTLQAEIDKEAVKYGDIVQETFVDHYRNLSLKSIALMKWVTTLCSKSSFVLKVDDDMYINVNNLLQTLRNYSAKGNPDFIIGYLHPTVTPIREEKSRYLVTKTEFSGDMFPSYVSGTAYALPTTAAMKLYNASFYVPRFLFEDVYVTGLVATKANISRIHNRGFTKHTYDGCALRKTITSGHTNTPKKIRELHQQLYDLTLNCTEMARIAAERYADYIRKKQAAKKKLEDAKKLQEAAGKNTKNDINLQKTAEVIKNDTKLQKTAEVIKNDTKLQKTAEVIKNDTKLQKTAGENVKNDTKLQNIAGEIKNDAKLQKTEVKTIPKNDTRLQETVVKASKNDTNSQKPA